VKLLSSLDPKDRKLLLWSVGIAAGLAVAGAFFLPNGNNNDNPLPSSYLSGRHGARAAYETLLNSGYKVERWERPLTELVPMAGKDTVVIFAQPLVREAADMKAVREILERGGRVLATGYLGGLLLPGAAAGPNQVLDFAACKLDAEGMDALAGSGEAWMVPAAGWTMKNPAHRVQYRCGGQPAVVEYAWQKGQVVWWASSTPLENGSIGRAHDLDLFLNSLGPRDGHRFYWDESLHGETRTTLSYAGGASWTLLWYGLLGLSLLVVMSFSRRSGPVRDLPVTPRAAPTDFLEALGSLYHRAGAASTAVEVAWDRFRRFSVNLCGQRDQKLGAAELAAMIRSRFPSVDAELESDLAACEEAAWGETAESRRALKLVQTLHLYEEKLAALAAYTGRQPQNAIWKSRAQR